MPGCNIFPLENTCTSVISTPASFLSCSGYIEELIGVIFLYQGSTVPLVVKWADTEKERLARRAQKAQSQPLNMVNADTPQQSLFGALPMGYMPPYNGYGYQVRFLEVATYSFILFARIKRG